MIAISVLATRWLWWQRFMANVERFARQARHHPTGTIIALFGFAVIIRICLLWLAPIPIPMFHDEFSYLLGADTFAHGRLTNPTPAIPTAFETIHVNMWPTYQSMYMPGNAILLLFGHLLGMPWLSVLCVTSLFCGGVYWLVLSWLPEGYALATAFAAITLTQSMNGWWDSYFCIGLPAVGGLLVLGSLPRILNRHTLLSTLPLAVGLAILILTRPYEGFCVGAPAIGVLVGELRRRVGWKNTMGLAAPGLSVLGCLILWLLFYDWRGTGHPLFAPYMLNYRTYHITGAFLFSSNQPIPTYHLDLMRRFYMNAELPQYAFAHEHPLLFLLRKITVYYYAYFLGVGFLLLRGLLYLVRHAREPLVIALLASFIGFGMQVLVAAWSPFPQYAAPVVPLFFLLIGYGLYSIRQQQNGAFNGISLSRGVILAEIALALSCFGFHVSEMHDLPEPQYVSKDRSAVASQVLRTPGRHLILVRYTPGHDGWQEWVFNGADLQSDRVVWARSLDPATDAAVIAAYPNRSVWLAKPDYSDDLLGPYKPWTSSPLPERRIAGTRN